MPKLPGAKTLMADKRPQRMGVVREGWKFVLEKEKTELFVLPEDPMETRNLALERPDRVRELAEFVHEWDRSTRRHDANPEEEGDAALSADDVAAMKSLGYIE